MLDICCAATVASVVLTTETNGARHIPAAADQCGAYYMEAKALTIEPREALGIVISRGSRAEAEPRFSAYVWSAAPETETDSTTKAA